MTVRVRLFSALLASCSTLLPTRADAQTAVRVSAQIGDFHLAVSNYYRVPEREVIIVRDRRVRDDDIPVVFFIAQRARVAPAAIVDLRLRGLSWWDISVRYHLGADVFYVPVSVTPGPPYGKAYGHYKKPRNQWKTIVLTDTDVVNLVQLRFLSEHYHVTPERIMQVRAGHGNFVAVHHEVSGRGKMGDTGNSRAASNDPKKGDDATKSSNSTGHGRGRGGL